MPRKKTAKRPSTKLELPALPAPERGGSERVTQILREEDHDPWRELVRVAKSQAPLTHPTVLRVLEFLRVLPTRPDMPSSARQAAVKLIEIVERDLLGYTTQAEVNRINIALLPYARPELKSIEFDTGAVGTVAAAFFDAVTRAGAKPDA